MCFELLDGTTIHKPGKDGKVISSFKSATSIKPCCQDRIHKKPKFVFSKCTQVLDEYALECIFDNLDFPSKIRCLKVSRAWHEAATVAILKHMKLNPRILHEELLSVEEEEEFLCALFAPWTIVDKVCHAKLIFELEVRFRKSTCLKFKTVEDHCEFITTCQSHVSDPIIRDQILEMFSERILNYADSKYVAELMEYRIQFDRIDDQTFIDLHSFVFKDWRPKPIVDGLVYFFKRNEWSQVDIAQFIQRFSIHSPNTTQIELVPYLVAAMEWTPSQACDFIKQISTSIKEICNLANACVMNPKCSFKGDWGRQFLWHLGNTLERQQQREFKQFVLDSIYATLTDVVTEEGSENNSEEEKVTATDSEALIKKFAYHYYFCSSNRQPPGHCKYDYTL